LIEAAVDKTKAQIELLLAERFPQPDLATILTPIAAPTAARCPDDVHQHAPGHVPVPLASGPAHPLVPEPVDRRARVTPLAPQRFGMQVTLDAETHELLRDVQALLGHTVPSGDLAAVLRESLRLAKQALEKRPSATLAT